MQANQVEYYTREQVIESMDINEDNFLEFHGDEIDLDSVLRQQYRECISCRRWVALEDYNGEPETCDPCENEGSEN